MSKEVKDGFLGDLENSLQSNIMQVHKLIKSTIKDLLESNKEFSVLNNDEWAKSKIDEFLVLPTDKHKVGSVRVYKTGNKYSCMIQATGHFENPNEHSIEKALNNLIESLYEKIKKKIKDEYNLILRSEYKNGESFEGFDLWVVGEEAKKIWDLFEFKSIKKINAEKELDESVYDIDLNYKQLPRQLKKYLNESVGNIVSTLCELCKKAYDVYVEDYSMDSVKKLLHDIVEQGVSNVGQTSLSGNNRYFEGTINISPTFEIDNIMNKRIINGAINFFNENYTDGICKLKYSNIDNCFQLSLAEDYAKMLYEHLQNYKYNDDSEFTYESSQQIDSSLEHDKSLCEKYHLLDIHLDSEDILHSLCERLSINPTQANLDTISNIFTEEFLPKLNHRFDKFQIKLLDYPTPMFEVSTSNIDKEFAERLLKSEDTIESLLHKENTLTYRISPISFKNKSADSILNFLKKSIQFYSEGIDLTIEKLIHEYRLMNSKNKFIIENTNLNGLIPMLIESLFIENNFSFKEVSSFEINSDSVNSLSNFFKLIFEDNQYIDNCKSIVETVRELNYDVYKQIKDVPMLLEQYHNNELQNIENQYQIQFENAQIDDDWHRKKDKTVELYQEGFFSKVKKLKKLPSDLVAYITIETEAIKDYNDKLMIASYTIGKLEIVEWYIELLEVGSKNYIVPYTKEQLQRLRTQLLNCYKKIMDVKIGSKQPTLDDLGAPYNY